MAICRRFHWTVGNALAAILIKSRPMGILVISKLRCFHSQLFIAIFWFYAILGVMETQQLVRFLWSLVFMQQLQQWNRVLPASTAFTVMLCQPAVSRSKTLPSVMAPVSGLMRKIISRSEVGSMENLDQREETKRHSNQHTGLMPETVAWRNECISSSFKSVFLLKQNLNQTWLWLPAMCFP